MYLKCLMYIDGDRRWVEVKEGYKVGWENGGHI